MTQQLGPPAPARTARRWTAISGLWWRRWLGALATLARVEPGAAPLFLILLLPAAGLAITLPQ